MQNVAPNEIRELKYVAILLARGVGLAAFAGILWGLPGINWIFWIAAALGIFPAIFAISVVAVAAAVARNILCRVFNLVKHPRVGFCIGAIFFVGFLGILVVVFIFGEDLVARFITADSKVD